MKVIYEPKGRAKEYADLAVNLYNGCSHGCKYCCAPQIMHRTKEDFFRSQKTRPNVLESLSKDLLLLAENEDHREVLMCFSCDPYQQIDVIHAITRKAILGFVLYQQPFSILTKGGKRSERDFDLLAEHPELCRYGITLVFADDELSKEYEPGAAPTSERIESLRKAHDLGIKTWVSLEPTWSYADVRNLIYRTKGFVDEYKIGKLNYHPHAKEIYWREFRNDVASLCEAFESIYQPIERVQGYCGTVLIVKEKE